SFVLRPIGLVYKCPGIFIPLHAFAHDGIDESRICKRIDQLAVFVASALTSDYSRKVSGDGHIWALVVGHLMYLPAGGGVYGGKHRHTSCVNRPIGIVFAYLRILSNWIVYVQPHLLSGGRCAGDAGDAGRTVLYEQDVAGHGIRPGNHLLALQDRKSTRLNSSHV